MGARVSLCHPGRFTEPAEPQYFSVVDSPACGGDDPDSKPAIAGLETRGAPDASALAARAESDARGRALRFAAQQYAAKAKAESGIFSGAVAPVCTIQGLESESEGLESGSEAGGGGAQPAWRAELASRAASDSAAAAGRGTAGYLDGPGR